MWFDSCKPDQCEEVVPVITFKDISVFADTTIGKLTITFKDCDGDIGLSEGDTLPPYHFSGSNYYNLKCKYIELQNGVWVEKKDLEPPFFYRTPVITPEGKNKTLEGDIEVTLDPSWYLLPIVSPYDTFKYKIQLIDRALNVSNSVETPILVRP